MREGVVLNPHYDDGPVRLGVLDLRAAPPGRHGPGGVLTALCEPVNAADALRIGLADQVLPGPRPAFEDMVLAHARRLAGHADYPGCWSASGPPAPPTSAPAAGRLPHRELAEMSRDIFDDRRGFAAARRAFVMKRPANTQRTDTQRIVA